MSDTADTGRMIFEKTWLRFDDVECVRCRRLCGPEGAVAYRYPGEGMVCVECHEAAQAEKIDGSPQERTDG